MVLQTFRGARSAWILAAALWFGGCAAYNAGSTGSATARVPMAQPHAGRVTVASWYGPGFQGRRTASGGIFNDNGMTAASRTLPLGSRVRVINLRDGRSVVVRINDRGPYIRGRGIDLSERAAERLGIARRGIARVRVERLDSAASVRDARHRRRTHRETLWHYLGGVIIARRYYHASILERPRPAPRMVSSPVGDWLLGMLP